MPAATCAVIFSPGPDQCEVPLGVERARYRREETRPSRAAIVFHCRSKQRQIAGNTSVDAGSLFVIQRTAEGALRTFLAQHLILRRFDVPTPATVLHVTKKGQPGGTSATGLKMVGFSQYPPYDILVYLNAFSPNPTSPIQ